MNWLNDLIQSLFKIFPRIRLVNPNEAGIRVTLGTRVKVLIPGWYLVWPIIQTVEVVIVVTQITDLKNQPIRCKCGTDIVFSGAIQYKITNVRDYILAVHWADKSLQVLALGVIVDFVTRKTLNELQDLDQIKNELRKDIREASSGWGIRLQDVFITLFSKARTFNLVHIADEPIIITKTDG